MTINKSWKKELSRDFLALGSWIFFLLVVVRLLILPNKWPYLYHLIIAGLFILVLEIFVKDSVGVDYYVTRALVLAYFTSIFYENNLYNIFVGFSLLGFLVSSWYVGRDWKKTGYGVLLGAIVVGVGWWLGGLI